MFLVGNQREYLIVNLVQRSEYRIKLELDKNPSAIEQNNHWTKIVNVYLL